MAKQKPFHSKLVAKVKRDCKPAWTGELVDMLFYAAFSYKMKEPVPQVARDLLGPLFPCFQQEAFIASSYDAFLDLRADAGDYEDCPSIYPAIMIGWETLPKAVELEAAAVEFLKATEEDFRETPLEALMQPFPACLLIDTRAFGFSLHGISVDGVFAYPSYDAVRRYPMLHFLGVSMKRGFSYALEAKLVLKGSTLGDAMLASEDENRIIRRNVLAGLDRGGHDILFSPLDDERLLVEFVSRILAFSFGEHAFAEERSLSTGTLLRVSLRLDEVSQRKAGRASGGAAEDSAEAEAEKPERAEEASAAESAVDEGEESVPVAGVCPDAVDASADDVEEGCGPAAAEPVSEKADTASAEERSLPDYDVLLATVDELTAENAELRDAVDIAESKVASLSYHLKQVQAGAEKLRLEAEAFRRRAELVETMAIPSTPLEALELAERAFPDKLVVMDEARKSARDFQRGSTSETWAVLQAVAVTLHRLVFQQSTGSLTHAFQAETGFEVTLRDVKHTNKNAVYAKERRVTYAGEAHDITAHVKGRGVKKGECLRVHFFADYGTGKIVIAHCGEHLTTIETSKL